MKYRAIIAALLLIVPSVHPSQSGGGGGSGGNNKDDDEDRFDNFANAFDELDKQDKINSQFDQGYQRWEDGCLKVGGQKVLDKWLKAQENLIYCVMQNFNLMEIQEEISLKKKTGDLDLVFKKYCGQPVRDTRPCIESFLEASRDCIKAKDPSGINVTMNMIDSAVDFMCHNSGDRMALFMAEEGITCVTDHQGDLLNCLNSTDPELFGGNFQKTSWIMFDQSHCRTFDVLRRCVESELLKCNDPTPSNIVNSMLLAMRNATPCRSLTARASFTAASAGITQRPDLTSRVVAVVVVTLLSTRLSNVLTPALT